MSRFVSLALSLVSLASFGQLPAQTPEQIEDWERQFGIARTAARGEDTQAALAAYDSALSKAEVLGAADRRLATTLNSFAIFCLQKQLYDRAEPLFERAAAAYEEIYGRSHEETSKVNKNFAVLCLSIGKLGKAKNLFEKVLEREKEALDKHDPALAETHLGLAMIAQKRDETAAAESEYRRVLRIRKEAFSEEHPSYIDAFNLATGMYVAKINALAQDTSIKSAWDSIVYLDRTVALHADFGDGVAGEQIARQALFAREQIMGRESPAVCRSLGHLATMLRKQGKYDEAQEALERAFTITARESGLDQTARTWILLEMARVAESRKDPAEVERYFDRILAIEEEAWGASHPHVVSQLKRAIEFMERMDAAEATQRFQAALDAAKGAKVARPVYQIAENAATLPRLVKKIEPEFSEEARQTRYEATVMLGLNVTVDGRADNIRVYRCAGHGLDKEAIKAVKKWRFKPGLKDGSPVDVSATVEVNFRIRLH